MVRGRHGLLALMLVLVVGSTYSQEPVAAPMGSYRIRICDGRCSAPGNHKPLWTGWLVLAKDRFALSDVPERLRPRVSRHASRETLEGANGCMALEFRDGTAELMLTRWTVDTDGTVRFPLGQTVDSGYYIAMKRTSGGYAGVGFTEHGFLHHEYKFDTTTATRVGEADRRVCFEFLNRLAGATDRSGSVQSGSAKELR
jgi:hypothetical protein